MAFDWRKKLDEAKLVASVAFSTAVEKGTELSDKLGKKAEELDKQYGPQIDAAGKQLGDATNKLVDKVEKKISDLAKKPDAPKQ